MARSLMLINPAKRKSAGRKKPRSAAQKAATRKMVASNRRRRNPAARSGTVTKRRVSRAVSASRKRSPVRRRNPASRSMGKGVVPMLLNSLKGAGGAIAVNAVVNFLPDVTKTGKLLYVTRAGLAIMLGVVGSKMLGSTARSMAEGALVVNTHDLVVSMLGGSLPGGDLRGVGEYVELDGVGEYLEAGSLDMETNNSTFDFAESIDEQDFDGNYQ